MGTFETYDFIYRGYARTITIAIAAHPYTATNYFRSGAVNHVGDVLSRDAQSCQNKIPVAACNIPCELISDNHNTVDSPNRNPRTRRFCPLRVNEVDVEI